MKNQYTTMTTTTATTVRNKIIIKTKTTYVVSSLVVLRLIPFPFLCFLHKAFVCVLYVLSADPISRWVRERALSFLSVLTGRTAAKSFHFFL